MHRTNFSCSSLLRACCGVVLDGEFECQDHSAGVGTKMGVFGPGHSQNRPGTGRRRYLCYICQYEHSLCQTSHTDIIIVHIRRDNKIQADYGRDQVVCKFMAVGALMILV
jgi:hypothetical protein